MASQHPHRTEAEAVSWTRDTVVTSDGTSIPVRATARRPRWDDLPVAVREHIEEAAGCAVIDTWSAGTGFTPGFASRLDLADESRVFVKAASSADDRRHEWPLSSAYREEARKLRALGPRFAAPPLLWTREVDSEGERWVLLGLEYVEGRPPRRPWQDHELRLVLDKLADLAPALAAPPPELGLTAVYDEIVVDFGNRLGRVRELQGSDAWLDTAERLCADSAALLVGDSLVHLDLRDDNVLISDAGEVWFVDWNFPALGAPWIDLVCILLSARGDGHDVEEILRVHPLTRDVDPHAIDSLLALLWSYWGIAMTDPVPAYSPHLRDHQQWYADVTRSWLRDRLTV
ncbi:MAG: phosphotransferase [Nocardioidaceae bacterium]